MLPSSSSTPQHESLSPNNFNSAPHSSCQICGKLSHRALDCFHRMDYSFQQHNPHAQLVAMVAQTNVMHEDDLWYANSGANNHITNDVANLSLLEPYGGEESVAIGNDSGLPIQNIGSLILHTPLPPFNLNRVLHYLTAITKLAQHAWRVLVRWALLHPYQKKTFVNKCRAHITLFGVKIFLDFWHARLGHPSSQTTTRVISPLSNFH